MSTSILYRSTHKQNMADQHLPVNDTNLLLKHALLKKKSNVTHTYDFF